MPRYTFKCLDCGVTWERRSEKFTPPDDVTCPSCGSENVRRVWRPPLVRFRGSGFYVTDSAREQTPVLPKSGNRTYKPR